MLPTTGTFVSLPLACHFVLVSGTTIAYFDSRGSYIQPEEYAMRRKRRKGGPPCRPHYRCVLGWHQLSAEGSQAKPIEGWQQSLSLPSCCCVVKLSCRVILMMSGTAFMIARPCDDDFWRESWKCEAPYRLGWRGYVRQGRTLPSSTIGQEHPRNTRWVIFSFVGTWDWSHPRLSTNQTLQLFFVTNKYWQNLSPIRKFPKILLMTEFPKYIIFFG